MEENQPFYRRIYRELLDNIRSGVWKPGDRLPSEKEWAERYGVSRITSKKALDMAAEQGIIRRYPGKGSFITEQAYKLSRNEKRRNQKILGLIQPGLSESYGLGIFLTLQKLCRQEGFLMLSGISEDLQGEKELLLEYKEYGVDGILIFPVHNERFNHEILKLIFEGFPVVLLDRYLKDVSCPNVVTDNQSAACSGMEHLFRLNHRHIGILSRCIDETTSLQEREKGVISAYRERGMKINTDFWLIDLDLTSAGDDEAFRDLTGRIRDFLRKRPQITALFALEYGIVPLIEQAAADLALEIPGDLSVLCFDSPGSSQNRIRPVTHLRQNEEEIARQAFSMIRKSMKGEDPGGRILVEARLNPGETAALLPATPRSETGTDRH